MADSNLHETISVCLLVTRFPMTCTGIIILNLLLSIQSAGYNLAWIYFAHLWAYNTSVYWILQPHLLCCFCYVSRDYWHNPKRIFNVNDPGMESRLHSHNRHHSVASFWMVYEYFHRNYPNELPSKVPSRHDFKENTR